MKTSSSRSRSARRLVLAGLALASMVLLSGAALAEGTSTAPAGSVLTAETGATASPIRVADPAGPPGVVSAVINGAVGGELRWGRFRLVVPPRAWYGPATVTLTVPDPSVMACELAISPSSANGFSVPVALIVNSAGAAPGQPLVIGWFDPSLQRWTPVPSSWHMAERKLVVAPLYHFSTYGVFVGGKAGW